MNAHDEKDKGGAGRDTEHVGWHVILDSTTWCTECAATLEDARRLAGSDPGSERVRVAPVEAGWAADLDIVCAKCGRSLAR